MRNLFTLSSFALCVALSFGAHAAKQEKQSTSLQQHSEEYKLTETEAVGTLNSSEGVSTAHELTKQATEARLKALSIQSQASLVSSQLKAVETQDELAQKTFLFNNVPPEVRLAGDKAVKAYLNEHFLQKKPDVPTEKKQTETIWSSSQTSLAALTPITPPPSAQVAASGTPLALPSGNVPAANQKALEALGVTPEELAALAAGDDKKSNSKQSEKKKQSAKKPTHSVKDIRWNRVVVMGKVKRADLTVTVRAGESKLDHTINNLEPGSQFKIADTEYEVNDITEQAVVLTEIKSKKSHRVTVR